MEGAFTHYLNDQEVDEPKGWADFTQVIERNEELRFIGVKYEGAVTFYNGPLGGHDRLRELYNDSSCQIIAYRVTQECQGVQQTAFEASIIIREIDWNINKCTATTTVADNSYGSYIVNNAEITLRPTSTQAKLGTEISPAEEILVGVYDPNAPSGYINVPYVSGQPGSPTMWDWRDAMSHAVRYMSEGVITGISSEWYNNLNPENERYALTSGYLLRNPGVVDAAVQYSTERVPLYSFNRLWQNMWKKYDLWSAIETDYNGDVVLRVEPREYFFGSTVAVTHDDQDDLIQGTDLTQLYARVKVGSEVTIKGVAPDASLPFLFLMGFTEEDYHIPISCNTSATLDLITDFIIDSNVIETVLLNASTEDSYDDDVFMIQYGFIDLADPPYFAVKFDYITPGTTPYNYNFGLLNQEVLKRIKLLGAIQYITQETDGFLAEMNTGPLVYRSYTGTFGLGTFTEPVTPQQHRFNQDFPPRGDDPNNNYGNGTTQGNQVSEANSRYTASQQGLFGFEFQLIWQVYDMEASLPLSGTKPVALRVLMERYDVSNVLVDTPYDVTSAYTTITQPDPASLKIFHEPDAPVYMNVGDYVVLKFQFLIGEASLIQSGVNEWQYELRIYRAGTPGQTFISSYWKTNYVAGQGGIIIASDHEEIYQNTFKYVRHVPLEDWLFMVSDPTAYVQVGPGQVPTLPGYARRLARNVNTGNVDIELIAATPNSFV